ncbi:hypothetical protein COZ78_01135 [bacterium (Candidatus Gribaldobacteria) CG_4_8_14_3_um_filter_42_11]|uniref:Four helix bundle protein n=1 Tax=bacterium (Candidatus Gribaldobacteria) CG_4_8_14_3_um_filter_42_11 TaxID=2014267 RepID=A0A2M7IYR1_9BACT|nr:MAG: hypothetical protein COZ78_01135 [bacterium (Candidatus Gribaldobacteria) CG_4_8_14_3_um_filter_42_11]
MKNDNANFKMEFKKRIYNWVLRLIKFIDKLPKDSVCQVMGKQLLNELIEIANVIASSILTLKGKK